MWGSLVSVEGPVTWGMLVFKTKDAKMQSPIKSSRFLPDWGKQPICDQVRNFTGRETVCYCSQRCSAVQGWSPHSICPRVRNYCFELEILGQMRIAKEHLGDGGGSSGSAFRATSCSTHTWSAARSSHGDIKATAPEKKGATSQQRKWDNPRYVSLCQDYGKVFTANDSCVKSGIFGKCQMLKRRKNNYSYQKTWWLK